MLVPKRLRIRMYRGILGDCFLLRVTGDENGQEVVRSMLIDCGVLHNVPSGKKLIERLKADVVKAVGKHRLEQVMDGPTRIREVARDVLREVGGQIDLLVVTHEHYDHLSGFAFEKDGFLDKDLKIDRLWMAWTENPDDDQAKVLQARFSKGRKALAETARLALNLNANVPDALRNAAALAAFSGPAATPGMAVAGGLGTGQIMQMLKDKVGPRSTRYLEPGQVIDLEDFGIRAYVLGPPREEDLLTKDMPSHGPDGHPREVYLTRLDTAMAAESTAATRLMLSNGADPGSASFAEFTPFSAIHLRPVRPQGGARRAAPSRGIGEAIEALYYATAANWRKIDGAWTESIEALALKMNSDTNNTSLVLAFELPDGQVLLFPGDAQVGNWLSWDRRSYPDKVPSGSSIKQTTAEDLLRRATFYKVGHHGSHNATAKALGLERMIDPRLVAAIPVVEAVAAVQGKGRDEPGKGWKMPYGNLYQALTARTQGRIVQGDGDPDRERRAFASNPTHAQHPVSVEHSDLWVELTFELA